MSYSGWHLVEFICAEPPVFFHSFPRNRFGVCWAAISFGEGLVLETPFSRRMMIRTFAPPSEIRSFQDFVPWLGVVLRERFVGEPSFSSTASHGSWGRRLPPGVSHASVFPRAKAGRGKFSESAFSFHMVVHVSCFSFLCLHAIVSILSFFLHVSEGPSFRSVPPHARVVFRSSSFRFRSHVLSPAKPQRSRAHLSCCIRTFWFVRRRRLFSSCHLDSLSNGLFCSHPSVRVSSLRHLHLHHHFLLV